MARREPVSKDPRYDEWENRRREREEAHRKNPPQVCRAFARAIEEALIENPRLRRQHIAGALGISTDHLYKLCNYRPPSLEQIVNLERYLGMSKGALFVAAGLVEMPDTAEHLVRLDRRFTPGARDAVLARIDWALTESYEERRGRDEKSAAAARNRELIAANA